MPWREPLSLLFLDVLTPHGTMPQDNKYAPVTTAVYVRGESPAERKDDLRTCLAYAGNVCNETWLGEPSFTKNVENASELIENKKSGKTVDLAEADFHEPIKRLRISHDKNAYVNGRRGMVKGASNTSSALDIIVTHPDALIDRSTGVERIQTLVDNNVTVHFAEAGVAITPGTDIEGGTKRALSALSDALHPSHEHDDDSTYSWSGGRPPLGFDVKEGRLVETDKHSRICTVLQQVHDQEVSKRRAAKRLGCSRSTIVNALEKRPEMYNIAR